MEQEKAKPGVTTSKACQPLGTKGNGVGWGGGELAPTPTVPGLCLVGAGQPWKDLVLSSPPEIWAVAIQGRGGAWTLWLQSPHSLDRELGPFSYPGCGLQEFLFVTPCSNHYYCL